MISTLTNYLADHVRPLGIFVATGLVSLPSLQSNTLATAPLNTLDTSHITTQSSFQTQQDTTTQPLAFETQHVNDDNLELGTQQIVQEGQAGVTETTTINTYYNDQLFDTQATNQVITPPIDKIIHVGTKIIPKNLETPNGTITYTQKFESFWATSYDSTCLGCSRTTATGMAQGFGVVAVDPKVIPLHSKLYIPGYGTAVAGDVGGSVKGNKIDLGYDSLNGQWSAHYVDVYLLAE